MTTIFSKKITLRAQMERNLRTLPNSRDRLWLKLPKPVCSDCSALGEVTLELWFTFLPSVWFSYQLYQLVEGCVLPDLSYCHIFCLDTLVPDMGQYGI